MSLVRSLPLCCRFWGVLFAGDTVVLPLRWGCLIVVQDIFCGGSPFFLWSLNSLSPPDPLSEAACPLGSQPPTAALTVVLEFFVFRVKVAFGRRASKNYPPPSPASSVSANSESDSAGTDVARPVDFVSTLHDLSYSEDYSALVDALITSVRETLKMEDAGCGGGVCSPWHPQPITLGKSVFLSLLF